jgi:hypothetical protein
LISVPLRRFDVSAAVPYFGDEVLGWLDRFQQERGGILVLEK